MKYVVMLQSSNNDYKLFCILVVVFLSLLTFWISPFATNTRLFLGLASLVLLTVMVCAVRAQIPACGAQLPLVGKSLKSVFYYISI